MNPTDPAPYLNVPLDLSEIDEAQEAAQAWAAHLGYKCYCMADTIADRLDRPHDYWKPEHAPALERFLMQLTIINAELQTEGHNVQTTFVK